MYCTLAEIRLSGIQMTTDAQPPARDELVSALIERVSRLFDHECGVADNYFDPALYPVWQSGHTYVVGDIVTPTTPNAHRYRVTTAGVSGNTEPSWTTVSSATFVNGTATFTENGADVTATPRIFYGDGTNYLKVDPYVPGSPSTTITLPEGYTAPDFIERDGYLIFTSSDHVLPSSGIRPRFFTNYGPVMSWYQGVPITLTAKWGYAATPADVKMAIIEWVINVWRETDPAGLKLVNLDGMPLREAIPPRVKEIAKFYRVNAARASFV